MAKRLTAATLKRAPPKAGQVEEADTVCPWLFLRRGSGGAQTYMLRGRVKGQANPIRLTIGDARQMDLKVARERAEELREKMLSGKDPREEERHEWGQVVADFIEKHAQRRNKSWRYTKSILDKKVTPSWGGKLISEITADDVKTLLNRIEDDVSLYQANRTLAAVRKLFNWARQRGLVKVSPVESGLARGGEVQRERVLAFAEIAAVWQASVALGAPFGPLVRMLMLTAQRRGETAGARWTGMDLEDERLWTLTAEETKADREHWVPLSPAALEIVKTQPLIADSEAVAEAAEKGASSPPAVYVFTTTGKTPLSGFSHAKRDLDAKLVEAGHTLAPWRFHDLRRTAATHMEDALGIPPHIVGAVLNHAPAGHKGVTARYTRGQLIYDRRRALVAWSRLLALIVAGDKTWERVETILRPETEDDAARMAEFRRFAQGDEEAWTKYVEGLGRPAAENIHVLQSA